VLDERGVVGDNSLDRMVRHEGARCEQLRGEEDRLMTVT
jgi:hypothetical protein